MSSSVLGRFLSPRGGSGGPTSASRYLLPLQRVPSDPPFPRPRKSLFASFSSSRRRSLLLSLIALLLFLSLLLHHRLGTLRRDLIYLIRPLWDTPEPPFRIISHFPPPSSSPPTLPLSPQERERWCGLHGWTARTTKPPRVVDAVLVSSELDMLEIRLREHAPFVDDFVIVESALTFSGEPKPLYFAENRARFERVALESSSSVGGKGAPARIVYEEVRGLRAKRERGSFENEGIVRRRVGEVLDALDLEEGTLVLESDVDEIISHDTLQLLTTCQGFPATLHLNVKNYLYGFDHPLLDGGYWRPHVSTKERGAGGVGYFHGRGGEELLDGAGWHCSFCFESLEGVRGKMRGYSHNDRLRDEGALKEEVLRGRVCRGEDPFGMWPEAFTFRELLAQSGPVRQSHSFLNLPVALQEDPERFKYLLGDGCNRPNG